MASTRYHKVVLVLRQSCPRLIGAAGLPDIDGSPSEQLL